MSEKSNLNKLDFVKGQDSEKLGYWLSRIDFLASPVFNIYEQSDKVMSYSTKVEFSSWLYDYFQMKDALQNGNLSVISEDRIQKFNIQSQKVLDLLSKEKKSIDTLTMQ